MATTSAGVQAILDGLVENYGDIELTDLQKSVREELLKVYPKTDERKSFLEAQTGRQLAGLYELTEVECSKIIQSLTKEEK